MFILPATCSTKVFCWFSFIELLVLFGSAVYLFYQRLIYPSGWNSVGFVLVLVLVLVVVVVVAVASLDSC